MIKKINSWFELLTDWCLNRLPSHGMLPSRGTCEMLTELVVWITPPIATVPPSVTSTYVVAFWVIRLGLPLIEWPKSGVVFSTSTFRKIVFSDVICGITVSRRNAST